MTAKNIPLGLANIGDTFWKSRARKIAFAISTVLPEMPLIPRGGIARLEVIICDPQPAVGERALLCRRHVPTIKHLPKTIFAAIQTGILAGAFTDSFHEGDCLSNP